MAPPDTNANNLWNLRATLTAASAVAVVLLLCLALPSSKPPPLPDEEVPRELLSLRDGRLYREGAPEPFSGIMIELCEEGGRKSRSRLVDGLLEGLSEGWHPDGQLQVQEHFRAGVSHGTRVKYYPDGTKLSEATIVNGAMEGRFRRWHENGALAEELELRQGHVDGLAWSFYPSGFVKARASLNNGTPVNQAFWNDGEQRRP
jgi:antitoxin component YwqK of YwqJK toxin-antitoxin module